MKLTLPILASTILAVGLSTAQAQSTFQGIAGEQEADPAPAPRVILPEEPPQGLSVQIAPPAKAELSKIDPPGSATGGPFYRSSIVTRHRVNRNGTTGLDIFDAIFD